MLPGQVRASSNEVTLNSSYGWVIPKGALVRDLELSYLVLILLSTRNKYQTRLNSGLSGIYLELISGWGVYRWP